VLSVGGSLGAKSINEAIRKDHSMFGEAGLQLIWQTGKPFESEGKLAAQGKSNIWCGTFITEMDQAYAAADIVISRAGAMAIAELCITGKPAVLVPFPFAAEDHQTHNARQLADRGAGILVTDAEAGMKLVPQVVTLAGDEAKRKSLSDNIRPLAVRHADEVIAGSILKELESK
jgi:UDP-N-acetylglucosamine--N-acetylmuramyl-(pentapeptide) pyrophosphoryl-undecaprenol N-acetylglucosamine transferase